MALEVQAISFTVDCPYGKGRVRPWDSHLLDLGFLCPACATILLIYIGYLGAEFSGTECISKIKAQADIHGHSDLLEKAERPPQMRSEPDRSSAIRLSEEEIVFLTGEAPETSPPATPKAKRKAGAKSSIT